MGAGALGDGRMGVLGADTRKMNKSGVKNGGGFPGIRNQCLLGPTAFLLGLLVIIIAKNFKNPN